MKIETKTLLRRRIERREEEEREREDEGNGQNPASFTGNHGQISRPRQRPSVVRPTTNASLLPVLAFRLAFFACTNNPTMFRAATSSIVKRAALRSGSRR